MTPSATAAWWSAGLGRWGLACGVLLACALAPLGAAAADAAVPPGACSGAWLGVVLDPRFAGDGARVAQVDVDGPAALAGVRTGDVIGQVGELAVRSADELARWAARTLPGETVLFRLSRSGGDRSASIELWGVPRPVCDLRWADHHLARDELVVAERYLREAVARRPRHAPTWQRLAEVLRRQNQPVEADEAAWQASLWEAQSQAQSQAPSRLPSATAAPAASTAGTGRVDGLKAIVVVGGFQVKAAAAGEAIGDGLREMLISALHQSGYIIVLERAEMRGVTTDRDLSNLAGAPAPTARSAAMDIADIMVYGAVTEFEPEAGGSRSMTPIMGMPLAIGTQIKWSQLAVDVRVVDVRTARVLGAQRIPGMGRSVQGTIAGALPVGPMVVPAGLNVYRNTPMEWAIRDCIRKAAYFVISSLDEDYFRHR